MDDKTALAVTVVGFALWQTASTYGTFAPSLQDMRDSCHDDTASRQQLLDCDVMVGGLAIMAGVFASWLSRSVLPVVATVLGFIWISGYHHLVLRGPTSDTL